MAHGDYIRTGKTIRFKAENPKHKDAIPYKRTIKHKLSYAQSY